MSPLALFVLVGAAVIAVLSAVAARLLWRLRHQERTASAQRDEDQRRRREQIDRTLRLVSGAALRSELKPSEAVLRLSWALDSWNHGVRDSARFGAVHEFADAVAHIPRRDAWQALDRDRRRAYEAEMRAIEQRFEARLRGELEQLRDGLAGLGEPELPRR